MAATTNRQARSWKQDSGGDEQRNAAQERSGRAPGKRPGKPIEIGVDGAQALIGDIAAAHHGCDFGVDVPRQKPEKGLPQPYVGDRLGERDRRGAAAAPVKRCERHDHDGAKPELRGDARKGCRAVLEQHRKSGREDRQIRAHDNCGHGAFSQASTAP